MASRVHGQYKLYAYVCGRQCVRRTHYEGVVTYRVIFNSCPTDCRYAVVSFYDVVRHEDRFAVFDMDATRRGVGNPLDIEPGPLDIEYYSTIDAAIMATALLYEDNS